MILFPAIDLKDGVCVRLEQGDMARATVFNRDPAAQANIFEEEGFKHLHIVDLDGAFAGKPMNAIAVEHILETVGLCVQLGGGIRDMAGIERWLQAGIARVILGSIAARDPALVRAACRAHPGRIVVGIDARGGYVATEGWAETSELRATELAVRFEDAGAAAIVYTDIGRDGMLTGLNLEQTAGLADLVSTPVIASGGVGALADLAALKATPAAARGAIEGVIVGRALYDGRVALPEALALLDA
jgi:phosphoribosylformimino-5-aminoimidazole carboxamide ribotide isomerase